MTRSLLLLVSLLALPAGALARPDAEIERQVSSTCTLSGVPQACSVRTRLDKASPTVADRVELVLEAACPSDLTVDWPAELTDVGTIAGMHVLTHDERSSTGPDSRAVHQRTYILEPFLPGARTIPPLEFRFRNAAGASCTLRTEAIELSVPSVLPEGTPPEPELRGFIDPPPARTPWWIWAGAGAALLGVAGVTAVALRRRAAAPPRILTPYEQALARLQELDRHGPGAAPASYAGSLGETLRSFIPSAFALPPRDRTSDELLRDLAAEASLNAAHLAETLGRLDEIAFGGSPTSDAELLELRDRVYTQVVAIQALRSSTNIPPKEAPHGV